MADKGKSSVDVAVIGGGIIGLAVAWRAGQRGLSVAVLERDAVGGGASHVAAGMLAPVSEAEFGEHGRRLLELGLRSADVWPGFAAELERASGTDVGLTRIGTLMVAHDDDEARELERQLAFRQSLGLRAIRLRASQAREREPALAPGVRLALEAPDDHSVDPRLAVAALRSACEREGVEVREQTAVAGLELEGRDPLGDDRAGGLGGQAGRAPAGLRGGRVSGVRCADGTRLGAREVVIAAGSWSAQLAGLPEQARVPVRPVKGQIMQLRDPAGPGMLSRAVRYAGGYVVPRADGRYVLGGTMEERGFDPHPTAGAIYELLRDAHEVVPGVSELELRELNVGHRPGTPDNAPIVGRGALEGLVWATGHHRGGILLAPLTAELVVELLMGESSQAELLSACDPGRFVAPASPAAGDTVLA